MKFDAVSLLVDEFPDAVVVMTVEGRVVHWSKGAQSCFGYAPGEALGQAFDDLVVPADRGPEQRNVRLETLSSRSTIAARTVRCSTST